MRKFVDGKRGEFLLTGGLVYTGIGVSYVAVRTQGREAAFEWIPGTLGPSTLGWVWILCGVLCAVAALLSKSKRQIASTAYAGLMLPPLAWSLIFLVSWITGTHPLGYVSALSYGLMALWVQIVSGWPNPLPRREGTATGAIEVQARSREAPHG